MGRFESASADQPCHSRESGNPVRGNRRHLLFAMTQIPAFARMTANLCNILGLAREARPGVSLIKTSDQVWIQEGYAHA